MTIMTIIIPDAAGLIHRDFSVTASSQTGETACVMNCKDQLILNRYINKPERPKTMRIHVCDRHRGSKAVSWLIAANTEPCQ